MRRRLGLVLVVAGLATMAACAEDRGPRTISDTAFVDAANAACEKALPALRAERRESDFFGQTDDSDREKTADRIEEVADGLDDLAVELAALPVEVADQGPVAAWLEEWANYTGIGRQYAAAVRTERANVYTSIAGAGNDSVQRIARFARANRIDGCVL